MQGAWSSYVEEHLIPRLNGFEILMASYSMAHLKLDMLLRETGYTNSSKKLPLLAEEGCPEIFRDGVVRKTNASIFILQTH